MSAEAAIEPKALISIFTPATTTLLTHFMHMSIPEVARVHFFFVVRHGRRVRLRRCCSRRGSCKLVHAEREF